MQERPPSHGLIVGRSPSVIDPEERFEFGRSVVRRIAVAACPESVVPAEMSLRGRELGLRVSDRDLARVFLWVDVDTPTSDEIDHHNGSPQPPHSDRYCMNGAQC